MHGISLWFAWRSMNQALQSFLPSLREVPLTSLEPKSIHIVSIARGLEVAMSRSRQKPLTQLEADGFTAVNRAIGR